MGNRHSVPDVSDEQADKTCMGNRLSVLDVSDEQADKMCELLVALLKSREAARLAGGHSIKFSSHKVRRDKLRLDPAPAQCACADLSALRVDRTYSSGSRAEGNDVNLMPQFSSSDTDMMFRLEPVRVLGDAMGRPDADGLQQEQQGQIDAEPGSDCQETTGPAPDGDRDEPADASSDADISLSDESPDASSDSDISLADESPDGEAVCVTQEFSGRPGFVLLYHQRRPECRHSDRLLFSADTAISLMSPIARQAGQLHLSAGRAGPSLAVNNRFLSAADLVACVRCPRWPSGEFASRSRPSGCPAPALVRRLCRRAALLVPVGARGTRDERHQWRLSFSWHELAALRALTAQQRACLTALKYCKAILGVSVAALKSYYLKTALLWLSEQHGADWWQGPGATRRAMLALLQWVEAAARDGRMPCYFWSEIDLLAGRDQPEQQRLAEHAAAAQQHLLAAATVLCVSRQVQWWRGEVQWWRGRVQWRAEVPAEFADLVPAEHADLVRAFCAPESDSTDQLLQPEHVYRAILDGHRLTMQELQKRIREKKVWPREHDINDRRRDIDAVSAFMQFMQDLLPTGGGGLFGLYAAFGHMQHFRYPRPARYRPPPPELNH